MIGSAPLTSRHPPRPLAVAILGRLSREKETDKKTEDTIAASMEVAENFLKANYDGPSEIEFYGDQASGYLPEREAVQNVEQQARTGHLDLILMEEIRCAYRDSGQFIPFVQRMVNAGVRVIALADSLDTGDPHWELNLGIAAVRQGLAGPDTRRRARRSNVYHFRQGGMVRRWKYGYRQLSEAEAQSGEHGETGLRIARCPECMPTLAEIRDRLTRGQSPQTVVDWLNDERIPVGPFVASGKWSVPVLKCLCCDPILQGYRVYSKERFQFMYGEKTAGGNVKYARLRNPDREQLHYPCLAHMTAEEQDAMLKAVGWQLEWGREVRSDTGSHQRAGVPRNRSYWPGQAVRCAACDGPMYLMGQFLKCRNCLPSNGRVCWNHVQANVDKMRRQVAAWLNCELRHHPAALDALLSSARLALSRQQRRADSRARQVTAEITRLETEIGHLVNAITQGGEAQALARAVTEREADLQTLRTELDDLEGADVETFTSLTDEALLDRLETVLLRLMGTSYEFADLLRELFAESYVVPVQTLDTGYARPRLVLRLNPAFVCGDLRHADVALDVFEPSAHLKVVEQVRVARTAVPPPSYARIARSLGVHLMTVKRAADYLRRMAARGTDTPYAVLHDPPDGDLSRWRRHRKPRRKAS